jgi:hypothetical protein
MENKKPKKNIIPNNSKEERSKEEPERTGVVYQRLNPHEGGKHTEGDVFIHKAGPLNEVESVHKTLTTLIHDQALQQQAHLNRELTAFRMPVSNPKKSDIVILETTWWKSKDKEWIQDPSKTTHQEKNIIKRVKRSKHPCLMLSIPKQKIGEGNGGGAYQTPNPQL